MFHPNSHLHAVSFCLAVLPFATASAGEASFDSSSPQHRFFESRIRPLLIEHCYDCHAGNNREGGLRLDVAESLVRGGDSGAIVTPGDPDASLMVSAVRYHELEMPPDQPLDTQQIADIETWVRDGAHWPITEVAGDAPIDMTWWAAQPLDPGPQPPPIPDSVSPTIIDRYLDHRRHEANLERAPPASATNLIRRLSYDLLGLPPSLESIDTFVSDRTPIAYEQLVDRMFADPAYGERMARLWLDLVRYAESDGWRADAYRPQAWRYRQFVTDAFNAKLPYDQFVQLQLAGDEIAPGDDQAIAAVGFLRLGIYEYNQRDAEGQWQNIVDELTDVTADVFLATGLACAKCHDHKFDPIPREDYFQFRSVFEPLLFVDRHANRSRSAAERRQVDELLTQLRDVEGTAIDKIREFTIGRFSLVAQSMYHKPLAEKTSYDQQIAYLMERQVYEEGLKGNALKGKIGKEKFAQWQTIREQLGKLGADPYSATAWMTVQDAVGEIRPTTIPGRTDDQIYVPAVPQVFGGDPIEVSPPTDAPRSSGRRLALARWITSPNTPITARVIVNRLWQYHFGTGLVRSPNDFGRLGAPPTHPKLLDYLAQKLIDTGWDLQTIQREIVSSAAYRQSAVHPTADHARTIDASNRLLWHKSVRRLDAEQFRDSLLVAMDRLIDQVGGPSIAGTGGRRSIYLRRYRNRIDEMLGAMDAPPGVVGTAKRDQTTTAPQALMMLNNRRLVGVASGFADRVRHDLGGYDANDFVRRAHRILTGHPPNEPTLELLAPLAATGKAGELDVAHVLLNSNGFWYID